MKAFGMTLNLHRQKFKERQPVQKEEHGVILCSIIEVKLLRKLGRILGIT
jgi:hypothetical protein